MHVNNNDYIRSAMFSSFSLLLSLVHGNIEEIHCYSSYFTPFSTLENVALRGVAFPSSRRWRTAGYASSVLDGNQITTCSATMNIPGQWMKVDLLVPYNVTIIQLAFEEDCCFVNEVQVDSSR